MDKRRLELLLVAWVVLVIVPGVIAARGTSVNDEVGGAVIGWWIGGYLAQFFVFMAVMRLSRKQALVLWLVASMLPWFVDWTLPASWLFVAPWTLVAGATAWWIYTSADREEDLRAHGVPAVGTVLKVIEPRFFNTVINNVYIKRKLRLRIVRNDGTPPYEAVLKGTFMLGEILGEGSQMNLRVDPKNPQRFVDAADDPDSGSASSYDDSAPPPDDAPDGSSGERSLSGQLEKLSALHKSGDLSDAEFAQAKEQLLGSN
ncbi:MAG: hypothetical protein JWQ70_2182 [Aeromicrobium sp.]|nr:hypothetical protein [Aeromicrobium sp.]